MSSADSQRVVIDVWTVAAAVLVVGLGFEISDAVSGDPDWALLVALTFGVGSVILRRYPHLDVELLDR